MPLTERERRLLKSRDLSAHLMSRKNQVRLGGFVLVRVGGHAKLVRRAVLSIMAREQRAERAEAAARQAEEDAREAHREWERRQYEATWDRYFENRRAQEAANRKKGCTCAH